MKILIMSILFFITACDNQQRARVAATEKAQNRTDYFMPKNDLDFHNYNKRQAISDDPTVILWCTSSFPTPNSPMFTVPIVGKLTSGSKRPFPDDPGPDGMYGSSGEYRYGFTPSGMYADWYGMPTFCTTEPMIWQRQKTVIVMQNDPVLTKAHKLAQEALNAGNKGEALRILSEAIEAVQ